MLSLQKKDPELWFYLRKHRLSSLLESLLSGLVIECPDDPKTFIIEKLQEFEKQGNDREIIWDMFISEENKPKESLIKKSWMNAIFGFEFEDEDSQPTPEMYHTAYSHYNKKLLIATFKGWRTFHANKKDRKIETERCFNRSRKWYRKRVQRQVLAKWHKWMKVRSMTHKVAYQRVQRMYYESLSRRVLLAWRHVIVEARRTKEYFAKIERGELNDLDEKRTPSRTKPSSSGKEIKDELSLLPRALAIKIFSYLNPVDLGRCAQVCRSWKVITQANQLWNRVDLSDVSIRKKITSKALQKILQKSRPYLGHLSIRGCRNVGIEALRVIGECRNLQDLNLSECYHFCDEIMHYIGTGCKILLYLNISQCEISDASLRSISRFCTNLQYLSLAYVTTFTVRGLQYLSTGKGCHKLTYFDLSGCNQVHSDGIKYVADCCPSLATIVLNDLPALKDEAILHLVNGCRNLKEISMLGPNSVSDQGFQYISQLRKLKKIKVDGNNLITDLAVKALGKNCSELSYIALIDCPRVTDLSMKALAACKQLTVLNVADCVRLSDTGLRHVVEGPSASKLRELDLSNCIRVSDVTLLRIAQRCISLEQASFCFCEHVTDAGAELMGGLANLVSLDLSGCFIQDQGLMALGNNTKFKEISIADSNSVTDFGVQRMSQNCRELMSLDMSHCTLITDNAIKTLAFCCRLLRKLKLSGCTQLTDISCQYISGALRYLEELDLSACSRITDKSIRYLRKGCKMLKKVTVIFCRNLTKSAVSKLEAKGVDVEYNAGEPSGFLESRTAGN